MTPIGSALTRVVTKAGAAFDEQRAASALSALEDARTLPIADRVTRKALTKATIRLRAALEGRDD